MNVIESPSLPEAPQATCLNCGAALVADQRYCLSCGQPCSPVRLAFLDVLQSERTALAPQALGSPPERYASSWEQEPTLGRLQRYSGLFGLLTVLLLAGLIGLLVGHWVNAGKTPATSVYKIEGLGGLAAAAPTTAAPTAAPPPANSTPTPTTSSKAGKATSEEASEASEAKANKAPPAPAKKVSSSTLNKIDHLKGKKYQQEINKITEDGQPLETGGG